MGNEVITVHSGNSTILRHGEAMCRAQQLPKQVHLVLDAPYGFALHRLAGIPCPVVVVTGVSSPSYLITLWELRPNSLIARPAAPHDVLYACESVAKGNRFYEGPPLEDGLRQSERQVLHHLAFGLCNDAIAEKLGLSRRTVEHRISSLYEKLGLTNKVELSLYYLGMHPRTYLG
jgi:DNA-binding NarL/FixJ family response regulator